MWRETLAVCCAVAITPPPAVPDLPAAAPATELRIHLFKMDISEELAAPRRSTVQLMAAAGHSPPLPHMTPGAPRAPAPMPSPAPAGPAMPVEPGAVPEQIIAPPDQSDFSAQQQDADQKIQAESAVRRLVPHPAEALYPDHFVTVCLAGCGEGLRDTVVHVQPKPAPKVALKVTSAEPGSEQNAGPASVRAPGDDAAAAAQPPCIAGCYADEPKTAARKRG